MRTKAWINTSHGRTRAVPIDLANLPIDPKQKIASSEWIDMTSQFFLVRHPSITVFFTMSFWRDPLELRMADKEREFLRRMLVGKQFYFSRKRKETLCECVHYIDKQENMHKHYYVFYRGNE